MAKAQFLELCCADLPSLCIKFNLRNEALRFETSFNTQMFSNPLN